MKNIPPKKLIELLENFDTLTKEEKEKRFKQAAKKVLQKYNAQPARITVI